MKRFLLEIFPGWLLLAIFGLIVIHAPLTVFLGARLPELSEQLKAWKELTMLAASLCIIVKLCMTDKWSIVWNDTLMRLVVVYVALHLALALLANLPLDARIAGLMIDLRYVTYFGLVYVYLHIYPGYRLRFLQIGISGACVVLAFAMIQLALPKDFLSRLGYGETTIQPYMTVDDNPDFVRYASTLRGPNSLGAYVVIVLAGLAVVGLRSWSSASLSAKKKLIYVVAVLAAIAALFMSYSRSAAVAAAAAVTLVFAIEFRKELIKRPWLLMKIGLLIAIILSLGLYGIRDSAFMHNVILHDNPTTGASLDSNTAHLESLREGLGRMLAQPFGAGVGSTGSASLQGGVPIIIENQYLMIAHESGWLGLAIFLSIYAIILRRLYARRADPLATVTLTSGIGLALVGFLLPVWADDTVSIVWWGLAAIALASSGVKDNKKGANRGGTTNKKTV